ncbi:MAG: TMEM175 family protein [Methanospirillum sp.]
MAREAAIAKSRVEALTDGIYAIAMTLLVLSIGVPSVPAELSPDVVLPSLVLGLWPQVLACAIAFLVLMSFWLSHERLFARVARLDRRFVNLNLITLLGIVFVPFSSALTSDYGTARIAIWVFAANLAAIGLLYGAQLRYLIRHPVLLYEPISPADARLGFARTLASTAAALLAVLLSFPAPHLSAYAYLLIPVFLAAADHMWSR